MSKQHADFPYAYLSAKASHIKYMNELYRIESEWLWHVRALRPESSWDKIVEMINSDRPSSGLWTGARLQRAARAYVAYGILSKSIFNKPKVTTIDDRLPRLADSIRKENTGITLIDIGRKLQDLGECAPNGRKEWTPTTVMTLLARADRLKRNSSCK